MDNRKSLGPARGGKERKLNGRKFGWTLMLLKFEAASTPARVIWTSSIFSRLPFESALEMIFVKIWNKTGFRNRKEGDKMIKRQRSISQ